MDKPLTTLGRAEPESGIQFENVRAVARLEEEALRNRSPAERVADAITTAAGSPVAVPVHVLWFAAWIALNLGIIPGIEPFDAFPFGFLTLVVSLEAIFLSNFILISQNRMARRPTGGPSWISR